jgi:hypothetical protein
MGGSQTTNQNSESQSVNEIPQWVQNAGQQNYAVAQDVASQPLQQYQGQLVAGISPQLQQAFNLAANSGSIGQGSQSAAQAALMSGAGYTPSSVTANQASMTTPAQLANTNLQPYMNPYTQNVINATLPIMQQNLALSQNQQQNAANSANAYGGSRQAIQQGVTQAQGAMGMGQMAAQLNQANYAQAQQGAEFDVGAQNLANAQNQQAQLQNAQLNLTGQQANQNAGLTANQQAIAAGQGLGNLGIQQMQNNIANYGMLASAGGLEQAQQQNDINAQIAQLNQAQAYPQQQLGILESALGMTPYDTGTSGSSASTTQVSTNNPAQTALGAMQMLGSLFSAPAGGTSAAAGAAALFGGSDRRLKTDIAKVGKHHTGVPIYSYRYKGDPKHYPKVVGPMAEDVAKIAPHAVSAIPGSGGKMAVNMGALNALRPGPAIGRGVGRQLGLGMGPPALPGALSAPGVAGSIGALGGSMMRPPHGVRRRQGRMPIMGALSG